MSDNDVFGTILWSVVGAWGGLLALASVLLALDRGTRRGRLLATGLAVAALCLAVFIFLTTASPARWFFVAATAASIALSAIRVFDLETTKRESPTATWWWGLKVSVAERWSQLRPTLDTWIQVGRNIRRCWRRR
ncbi:MAG: hypothetical protein PHO64_08550 [Thiomonas sp.]|nr:hypothetical protein [Thiomonas sp.]